MLVAIAVAAAGIPGALAAPPDYDNFSTPGDMVGARGSRVATNVEATKEVGEPDHAGEPGGASVWFSWTAPESGRLALDTCKSDVDTVLAVYTGSAIGSLVPVAGDNDSCSGWHSALEVDVIENSVYRIAVDGVGAETGDIRLSWATIPSSAVSPPNDHFENAAVLSGWSGTIGGTNLAATHQTGEGATSWPSSGSVWYRWTAPDAGAVTFETCGADFDTFLFVFLGTSLATRSQVTSSDDGCGVGSRATFTVKQGSSYAIVIDGWGKAGRGSFTLSWAEAPSAPIAVAPPTITGLVRAGQVLSGELGQWRGTPPISFEVWWERCPPLAIDCYPIPGERAQTIRPGAEETLRFGVRAVNHVGSAVAYSYRVTTPPAPPVNVSPPIVGGETRVGKWVHMASPGQWRGAWPISYFGQWQRCRPGPANCQNVVQEEEEGVEGVVYRLRQDDVGSVIRLVVIASNDGGSATAVSAPTSVIVAAPRVAQANSCVVPRLIGKRLRAARAALTRSRCRLGTVRRAFSVRKAGVVVRQSPKAGKRMKAGSRVNVILSRGRRR